MKSKIFLCMGAILTAALFLLTACQNTVHTHTFSDAWSYDEGHHWHEPTCTDTDLKKDLQVHTYENGVCILCGYKDPDYTAPTPPPVEDSSRELTDEELFEGTFTQVTNADEICEIRDYLGETLLRLGAGGGFSGSDICYEVNQNEGMNRQGAILCGLKGALISSPDLKVKRILHESKENPDEPLNRYASGNLAFEEYADATYVGSATDACKNVAKETIDEIWETFSYASQMFSGADFRVDLKEEKNFVSVKLFCTDESAIDVKPTAHISVKEQNTLIFCFQNGKVLALKSITRSEIHSSGTPAEYRGGNVDLTVRAGEFPFDLPDVSSCRKMDRIPEWALGISYPDENAFSAFLKEFEDETQESMFSGILSSISSRDFFRNANFKLTQRTGAQKTEMIFDLYNGDCAKIRKTDDEETIYTDLSRSYNVKGQATSLGESRFRELCTEFRDIFENDLMSLLNEYEPDKGFKVTFCHDDENYIFKIADPTSGREIICVYSFSTHTILAMQERTALPESGTFRETTFLFGDFSVKMPKI